MTGGGLNVGYIPQYELSGNVIPELVARATTYLLSRFTNWRIQMKELVFVFKACYRMYRGSGNGRHSMLSALVLSVRDTAHLYGFRGTYTELP